MKVLLLGATGNLGLRVAAALLTHCHEVIAYVRSPSKLESLLPQSAYRQLSVVKGDATDSVTIKNAIIDAQCDAVVNTAGLAALAPWKKSELPTIFRAIVSAVSKASLERKMVLRVWFLAGLGVLHYPGTESMLSNYIPIYLEHRQNLRLLQSLPPDAMDWSLLCPSTIVPESPEVTVPLRSTKGPLTANATTPPLWQDSWMKHIPLIGKPVMCAMNAGRYTTTLEQDADFIAEDLERSDSKWSRVTVGIISEGSS